ncbi:hypothetical protein BH11ARM1_BH11ARM1_11920 [soil metagenome]
MALALIVASLLMVPLQVPQQHISPRPVAKDVLATVNGVQITGAQVEPLLWDWRGHEVLQDLISFELVRAESHRLNIQVPEIQVLKVIDDQMIAMRANVPKGKDVNQALREQGYPMSRLYISVKGDLMLQALAERRFDPKGFANVSTMIFPIASAAATDINAAITAAQAAAKRLNDGEKWEDVVKSTQTDDRLVQTNGVLGWRLFSAFPEPARAELMSGPVGKVTTPVQTAAGIQIFRLDSKGSQAKPEEVSELKDIYMRNAKTEILAGLRAKAKIEQLWK